MSQYCFIHVQRRSQRRETVRKHVAALLKSTSSIPFALQLASHESEHQHRLDPTSAYLQKKGCLQGFTTHVVTPGAFGISCGLCGWARGRRTVKKPSADDMWIYLGPTQKRDRMIDVFTSQQFAVCLKLKQKIIKNRACYFAFITFASRYPSTSMCCFFYDVPLKGVKTDICIHNLDLRGLWPTLRHWW